ncbi:phage tail protein [Clostridium sp. MD294]|uniref:phage tail protein n=1 Tax=Clostridium sp. MD294 TaxID=97138 RepID=UPI0002CB9D40|nr:phage tail protein [Clostridium sp. MD294]USF30196.1 hypothetical protein C820_001637 [Clostridium sp. MD294]
MNSMIFDEELWKEGQCFDCNIIEDTLSVKAKENKKAVYISEYIDSGEKEMLWHRLLIHCQKKGQCVFSISYFATDNLEITVKKKKMLLPDFLTSADFSQQEKLYLLEPYWHKTINQQSDILLFDVKGQYFYFKIEILLYEESAFCIDYFRIEFPRESITSYLPSFYDSDHKNNSFLKRFLAVFHTMLFDMQQKIDNVCEYFVPSIVTGENLKWLADAMAVPEGLFWEEKIVIEFLQKCFLLYQKKGTKEGISMLVEIYTGKTPFIIESYEILQNSIHTDWEKEYTELYGKDIYTFFVLVEQQYLDNYKKYVELKKLLEAFQPAHTKSKLVVLRPFMVFGQHCYIGINSCLLSSTALQLNDTTILPFQTTLLE